jgi:hypothetical protein
MTEAVEEKTLTDAELRALAETRFRERVDRVLATMREQRIDFMGQPFVTPTGTLAARVVPIEMQAAPTAAPE